MRNRPLLTGVILFLGIALLLYVGLYSATHIREGSKRDGRVALVRIEGVILDSKDIVEELQRYGDSDGVGAIVLRIDSPGGGVAASQEIYEEVGRLRTEDKKTVVTSMGAVAASGGYYIAVATDKIVANPGTLTGSIGVIMELTNIEGLFKKIGLQSVVIKSGTLKDIGSPFRSMTEEERQVLQKVMDDVHGQFIEAVAKGRNMKGEQVVPYADGRIFTGREAKALGFVDELGDLHDAIHLAGKLIGLKGEPKVVETPKRFSWRDLLRSQFLGGMSPFGWTRSPVRLQYLMTLGS